MKKMTVLIWGRLSRVADSTWLFVSSLVLLALHSTWLILSSNLLPYDEYYHIGIIRFYAQQWSPIVSYQPPEMSLYGDVTRLSSYLYQYLMSFPYRFLDIFTNNEAHIIIGMRFLNLGMIVLGVILFRKLFLEAKISKKLINVATLVFVMTPIVPLMAAQNNYDNLMFMLTPVVLLYAYRLVTNEVTVKNVLLLGTFGMLATLVKHNFIVIFGATCLFVLVSLWRRYGLHIFHRFKISYFVKPASSLLVTALFLFVLAVFMERFGVNFIRYQQVKVDCARVQPVEVCQQFSPWRRNQAALTKIPETPLYGGALTFSQHWGKTIMRGFYAIFANIIPADLNRPDPYGHYVFKRLLPLPINIGYTLLIMGITALILTWRRTIRGSPFAQLVMFTSIVLGVSLWVFNFTFYLKYGRAYAIQARYLVPMLLPIIVIMGNALVVATHSGAARKARALIAALVLVYVFSGGVIGWVIKSNDNWYWPNNSVVLEANRAAKSVLKAVVPH